MSTTKDIFFEKNAALVPGIKANNCSENGPAARSTKKPGDESPGLLIPNNL